MNLRQKNRRLIRILMGVSVAMFGFGFALVPLYDVFCELTGLRLPDGGSGRIAIGDADKNATNGDQQRWVTLQFDSYVDKGLDWDFESSVKSMRVRVGEMSSASFVASNRATRSVVGHAVPSVAPTKAQLYFGKTECFCFTEQELKAGETRQMPVRFVISPDLPQDVQVMTLSYRFYMNEQATAQLAGNH